MPDKTKTKILFFDHVPIVGGAEQSLLDILRVLDRSRFEPVLLLTDHGPMAERARELEVQVTYVSIPGSILRRKRYNIKFFSPRSLWDAIRLLPAIRQVTALIIREKIGIVHTNTLKTHLIGGIAGRLCGRKVIWHFRDILVEPGLRMWMARLSLVLSDRVIAISGAVAGQFGQRYPASRITVVYNMVDRDEVNRLAATGVGSSIRRKLGMPRSALLVGIVGQIARWKGQEYFIRAAGILAHRYPGVYFLIVGDVLFEEWEYKSRLLELVKQLGLEQRVIFTGQWDNVYPVMKELAVMAHCSIEPEPFGRVVIEAMALGVPVVVADSGAMPEIIEHGVNGLLARADDTAAIAEAVGRLLSDAGMRKRLASNGLRQVAAVFSSERMSGRLHSALLRASRRAEE